MKIINKYPRFQVIGSYNVWYIFPTFYLNVERDYYIYLDIAWFNRILSIKIFDKNEFESKL